MQARSFVYVAIGLSLGAAALAACDLSVVGTQPIAVLDAAIADTYVPPKADTGVPVDAGKSDSGSPGEDAGEADSGIADTGMVDARVVDTGIDSGSVCTRAGSEAAANGKIYGTKCYWFSQILATYANSAVACKANNLNSSSIKIASGLGVDPSRTSDLNTLPYGTKCNAASGECWIGDSPLPCTARKDNNNETISACTLTALGNRNFDNTQTAITNSRHVLCEFPSP